MKRIQWKYLLISLAISLGVGALSTLLTIGNMKEVYSLVIKPGLSPAPMVFGIVWTVLFILMGISAYLVYTSYACAERKELRWKYTHYNLL